MVRVCQNQKQRALVYLFSSTGDRPQAIAELKMKHLEPIGDGCLSLRLYDGSLHEMYSFLHEKATNELKKYFEWREKQGEKLTPESLRTGKWKGKKFLTLFKGFTMQLKNMKWWTTRKNRTSKFVVFPSLAIPILD